MWVKWHPSHLTGWALSIKWHPSHLTGWALFIKWHPSHLTGWTLFIKWHPSHLTGWALFIKWHPSHLTGWALFIMIYYKSSSNSPSHHPTSVTRILKCDESCYQINYWSARHFSSVFSVRFNNWQLLALPAIRGYLQQ